MASSRGREPFGSKSYRLPSVLLKVVVLFVVDVGSAGVLVQSGWGGFLQARPPGAPSCVGAGIAVKQNCVAASAEARRGLLGKGKAWSVTGDSNPRAGNLSLFLLAPCKQVE